MATIAVFAVGGPVVRADDHQPRAAPPQTAEQAPEVPVHILQSCRVRLQAILRDVREVAPVRLMDGGHVHEQEHPPVLRLVRHPPQGEAHLVLGGARVGHA
jgi:hypothetical protein